MDRRHGFRRRLSTIPFLAVATATAGIGMSLHLLRLRPSSFVFRHNQRDDRLRRQLGSSASLSQFIDPKTVALRSDAEVAPSQSEGSYSRNNCQIVYILGVEGATHHGFTPIIEAFAKNQLDPETNLKYHVTSDPRSLKAGLLGWYIGKIKRWGFKKTTKFDDPAFVQSVVKESCPNNGQKHVLIEWASFPSGQEDDHRSYRVHRQHDWLSMTPEEIANDEKALQQPFNLTAFVQAYSPYADIKFVVLHRPFLDTIASHFNWDGGAETHSNIIRGFMLILGRFLDANRFDMISGAPLWKLVCVERIMTKSYQSREEVIAGRHEMLSQLADFLGWPVKECIHCFYHWRESGRSKVGYMGTKNKEILVEHAKLLEGVWPPKEEGVSGQQCQT